MSTAIATTNPNPNPNLNSNFTSPDEKINNELSNNINGDFKHSSGLTLVGGKTRVKTNSSKSDKNIIKTTSPTAPASMVYEKYINKEPLCGPWVSGNVRRSNNDEENRKRGSEIVVEFTKPGDRPASVSSGRWGKNFTVDKNEVYAGEAEVSTVGGPIGPITRGETVRKVKHSKSSFFVPPSLGTTQTL
jgi:hypothetical protein